MKKILILILLGTSSLTMTAQAGFEAGGWVGIANYFGDLNTDFKFNELGPAGGVALRYNFNNRLAMKLGGNVGVVKGSDEDSSNSFERARNLSFKSPVSDASLSLEFNFLPYEHGSKDFGWTPYLFFGFGVTKFNPQANIDDQWVELRSLGTEGQFRGEEYSLVSSHWVYGGGFKVDLSYEWSINIDFTIRKMNTDYLDDVSTVYPDMDDLSDLRGDLAVRLSDRSLELGEEFFINNNLEFPIGGEGRQRGNNTNDDFYAYFGIGLMYYFGDLRCPYER